MKKVIPILSINKNGNPVYMDLEVIGENASICKEIARKFHANGILKRVIDFEEIELQPKNPKEEFFGVSFRDN